MNPWRDFSVNSWFRWLYWLCLASSSVLAQSPEPDLTDFGLGDDTAQATLKVVHYRGDPVPITLNVGTSTRVMFDFVPTLGVPPAIESQLAVTSLPSGLFITAKAVFDPTPAQVRNQDNTRVIPVLLSATRADRHHTIDTTGQIDKIRVTDLTLAPPVPAKQLGAVDDRAGVQPTPPASPSTPTTPLNHTPSLHTRVGRVLPQTASSSTSTLVDLLRMVAQRTQGPSRLAPRLPGAQQITVHNNPVRLIPGGLFETRPVSAWQYLNAYATTVHVKNLHNKPLAIQPYQFVGHWRYASLHDSNIVEAGQTRTVYLISDRPFAQALRGVTHWRRE